MKNKISFSPYSDNVIFFDTEFSSLDPYAGEILSIGLVKQNGDELYLELDYDGKCSEWVEKNILPTLTQPKVSREEAREKVTTFVGPEEPYMIAEVNQFDVIYTYKLFGIDGHPFYWLPVDFTSILFGFGIDPELYNKREFLTDIGINPDSFRLHHALDDAKRLREVYLKLVQKDL